jgi:integrase
MAHIEDRRGAGRGWRVRYRDPSGKERSQSFRLKGAAEDFAATVEADKLRGLWIDPARGKVTVQKWSQTWLKSKADLRSTSRVRLEGILRAHVLPGFGDVPLMDVGNAAVREWVSNMIADDVGASTVRKSYSALAQMMRAAVSDRRVAFNPCDDVPLPPEHFGEQRFLSPSQVADLADSIEPRFRALVLLAVYGGLRFGELAGLRRGRVDVLRGRVMVAETLVEANGHLIFGPPKTKRSRRTVPLPRRIVAELERHLSTYVGPSADALFFTGLKDALLRRAGFRRCYWLPAVATAGLETIRLHDLRHTFVALWIRAGANPKEVSVRAGHSSVAFTLDRYGHLYEDAEDAVPDRLDALLGDPVAAPARPGSVSELRVESTK